MSSSDGLTPVSEALVPRVTDGDARRKKLWWASLAGVQALALTMLMWSIESATFVGDLVWFFVLDSCVILFMCMVYATIVQRRETTSQRQQLLSVTGDTELDVPVEFLSLTARTDLRRRTLSRSSSESVFWCALLGAWVWSPFAFMSIIEVLAHGAWAALTLASVSAFIVLGGSWFLSRVLHVSTLLLPSEELDRDAETTAKLEQKREQLGTSGGELSFAGDAPTTAGGLSVSEHEAADGGLELV